MPLPSIDETIEFIKHAHAGQEYAPGAPYWQHPVAVMERLPADATHEEKLAALLHDVIEDTAYSRHDLLARGYSELVLDMVAGVTSPPKPEKMMSDDEHVAWYRQSIESLASGSKVIGQNDDGSPRHIGDDVAAHRGAMRVKLADNEENRKPEQLMVQSFSEYEWFGRKYGGINQLLKDGLRRLEQGQSAQRCV